MSKYVIFLYKPLNGYTVYKEYTGWLIPHPNAYTDHALANIFFSTCLADFAKTTAYHEAAIYSEDTIKYVFKNTPYQYITTIDDLSEIDKLYENYPELFI